MSTPQMDVHVVQCIWGHVLYYHSPTVSRAWVIKVGDLWGIPIWFQGTYIYLRPGFHPSVCILSGLSGLSSSYNSDRHALFSWTFALSDDNTKYPTQPKISWLSFSDSVFSVLELSVVELRPYTYICHLILSFLWMQCLIIFFSVTLFLLIFCHVNMLLINKICNFTG